MNADELQKLLDEATPGPWELCAHLRHDCENGCTCGYRGVIFGREHYAICQPGHDVTPGEEGLDPPRLPRHEEVANMRLTALVHPLARRVIVAEGLLAAAKEIERWWIDEEMKNHIGAPIGMFMIRSAIAKYEATQ